VNNAYVYLYGTNGNVSDDSIVKYYMVRENIKPHGNVNNIEFIPFTNSLKVGGYAFTSVNTMITEVYMAIFADTVDLTDTYVVNTFMTSHDTPTEIPNLAYGAPIPQYVIGEYLQYFTTAYTDLTNIASDFDNLPKL
jgi:hypothetical protein